MPKIDYFKIIHKYITPDSLAYRLYIPHAALVTIKALRVAQKLGLPPERQIFIEEAAMLHDIGIANVGGYGNSLDSPLPYICHAPAGRDILEYEGLPEHALVAERHIGLGISKEEIVTQQLPLPYRDMLPESIEEKIITWADLFFTKSSETPWREKSLHDVRKRVEKYGKRQVKVFYEWLALFGRD